MLRSPVLAVVVLSVLTLPSCMHRDPDPPAGSRHITIASTDGSQLDAIEVGSGSDVAVLSHGATGTKEDFYGLATALADDGWRVIAYDARGVGDSTGPGEDRQADLRSVVTYARGSGMESLMLAGGSLGASLSISMAAELHADAVVSLSAPGDAFEALQAATELRDTPVLLVVAEDNEPYATDAHRLAEALGVQPTIVSGDRHGTGVFVDHPELMATIVAFADGAVGR